MDARTYLDKHGTEGAQALVAAVLTAVPAARISVGYFKQIAYGYRRPSFELAEAMVAHDPHQELEVLALLKAKKSHGGEGHAAP